MKALIKIKVKKQSKKENGFCPDRGSQQRNDEDASSFQWPRLWKRAWKVPKNQTALRKNGRISYKAKARLLKEEGQIAGRAH